MSGLDDAMDRVADDLELTVHRTTGAAPGEGTVQILIRASRRSRERWKDAASRLGISVAEMLRQLADAKAAELLDCDHPRADWRNSRHGVSCGRCGQMLNQRR